MLGMSSFQAHDKYIAFCFQRSNVNGIWWKVKLPSLLITELAKFTYHKKSFL